MPMYDSNLPWKEKKKILEAEIKKKEEAAKKKKRKLKRKMDTSTKMSPEYYKGYPGKYE